MLAAAQTPDGAGVAEKKPAEDAIEKIRLFSFNFLLLGGFAFSSPYIVLYLQSIGFSGAEIGVLAGITPLITFCGGPFWTGLADATRRHRMVMTLGMAVEVAGYILFPFLRTFLAILIVAVALNFFFAPVSAFADNATMFMLGKDREFYGRIRLGGTIGYALAAPLGGVLIGRFGLWSGFWSAAAVFFLALILSLGFVHAPAKESPPALRDLRLFIADPHWILFLAVSLTAGLALTGSGTFFLPYLKELGASPSLMGIALAIGAVTEIPVLFFGHRLLRRWKPHGLFMLATAFTGIRLLLFAAIARPDLALIVQLLNGFAFPMMWMAGVAYANEHAPAGLGATAQGIFGSVIFGFGMAMGGFLGGPLLESLGGRGLFLIFGGITLSIVAAAALIESRLPPKPDVSEQKA